MRPIRTHYQSALRPNRNLSDVTDVAEARQNLGISDTSDVQSEIKAGRYYGNSERIRVQGTSVLYNGQIIGTISSSGAAGTNLQIDFNTQATQSAVDELIQNITYRNTNEPATGTRTITWEFNDGTNTSVAQASSFVIGETLGSVIVIDRMDAYRKYVHSQPAAAIYDESVVRDPNNRSSYSTGSVTVTYASGGQTQDQLSILSVGTGAGQISVSGANVQYEGVTVGIITSNGTNGADLTVTFNTAISLSVIQAIVRSIAYNNTSGTPTASRTISTSINDGNGSTSLGYQTVIAVDSSLGSTPILRKIGSRRHFLQSEFVNGVQIINDKASVYDDDSPANYNGGYLKLTNSGNANDNVGVFDNVYALLVTPFGEIDFHGDFQHHGNYIVSGDFTVGGNLAVTGNGTFGGTLDVTGAVTFSAGLEVTSTIIANSNIDTGGNLVAGINSTNQIKLSGAATSNNPRLTAEGGDSNIGLQLHTKNGGSDRLSLTILNDGDVTFTGGVTGITTLNASGLITGGSLTDGIASINSGAATGLTQLTVDNIDINGNVISSTSANITLTPTSNLELTTGKTFTNSTWSLTSAGAFTGLASVTASGTIQGGTFTDGTASLTSGDLTSLDTIVVGGASGDASNIATVLGAMQIGSYDGGDSTAAAPTNGLNVKGNVSIGQNFSGSWVDPTNAATLHIFLNQNNGGGNAAQGIKFQTNSGVPCAIFPNTPTGNAGQLIFQTETASTLTTALTLDENQDATFASDIALSGNITGIVNADISGSLDCDSFIARTSTPIRFNSSDSGTTNLLDIDLENSTHVELNPNSGPLFLNSKVQYLQGANQTLTANSQTVSYDGMWKLVNADNGSGPYTGTILAAGARTGEEITITNNTGTASHIAWAADATSNIQDATNAEIEPGMSRTFRWDNGTSRWWSISYNVIV